MYAYPPIYEAAWPATPIWHPPAEVLEVVYPAPGPYARRKDSRRGSLAMAALSAPMMSMGFYGAEAAPPVPPATPAPTPKMSAKPVGKQIKAFFTKDESGTSKAGKVAERAIALATKKAEAAPAPAPIIIQAPAAPAAAGVSPLQLALIGLVALGVGAGAGYAFGRSR